MILCRFSVFESLYNCFIIHKKAAWKAGPRDLVVSLINFTKTVISLMISLTQNHCLFTLILNYFSSHFSGAPSPLMWIYHFWVLRYSLWQVSAVVCYSSCFTASWKVQFALQVIHPHQMWFSQKQNLSSVLSILKAVHKNCDPVFWSRPQNRWPGDPFLMTSSSWSLIMFSSRLILRLSHLHRATCEYEQMS